MAEFTKSKDLFDFHAAQPREKSDPKYGQIIAEKFLEVAKTGVNNYFTLRNERIERNRNIARGQQDMNEFFDLMKINGKRAFVNLDMKPPPIAPKFVEILIQRFMERDERPTVTAVDDYSQKEKIRKKNEAEFRMRMGGEINELQEAAGIPLEDTDAYTPEDEDDLELYFETEYRPKDELCFEKGIYDVLMDNDLPNLKLKLLHDVVKAGFMVSKVYLDGNKRIKIRKCQPESVVYSYSQMDSFEDCTMIGELVKMKVADIRKQYNIPEDQLFKMYQTSGQSPQVDNIRWKDDWLSAIYRPYDDATIEIFDFELITSDSRIWVKKFDRNGRMVMEQRKDMPANVGDKKEVLAKNIGVVYQGVYAVGCNKMISWKLAENMIKPHHALHEVFGSYVVTMPGNEDMKNMAIVERMENSISQMTVSLLKMQQLKSQLRPDEMAIDVSRLTNINLGDGLLKPFEVQEIFEQTGKAYYNGVGEDGETPQDVPFKPIQMSGAAQKMMALMNDYNFHLQLLRDMVGMNEATDGTGVGERTGNQVMNTQIGVSNRATDFIYGAWITHLNGIAKRIAILLWWNITHKGNYTTVMDSFDIGKKIYDLQISMLPTDADRQFVDGMIQTAITAGIVNFEEVFRLRRIAKTNVKLAEIYLAKYEKKRQRDLAAQSQQNAQANAQQQMASNAQQHQNTIEVKGVELQGKADIQRLLNDSERTKLMGEMLKTILSTPGSAEVIGSERVAMIAQAFTDNLLGVQQKQIVDNMMASQQQQAMMQQEAANQQMPQQ